MVIILQRVGWKQMKQHIIEKILFKIYHLQANL